MCRDTRFEKHCTGLVIKADESWPRGLGFKPRHRILDGCKEFASYYIKIKIVVE
jgi:hypothetical protein